MEYKDLLIEFAARIGISDDICLDDDGVWRIGTEDIVFSFREVPERDALLVYSSIGELPPRGAESFKAAILQANFLEQGMPCGVFSLDKDNQVWIHRYFDLKAIDVTKLMDDFENFVTLALEWRRLKDASRDEAEMDEVLPPDGDLVAGRSDFDFVRV